MKFVIMKVYFRCITLSFLSWMVFSLVNAQNLVTEVSEIAPGWAQTSVNATIFRKNSVVSYKQYQYVAWYDSTGQVMVAKRKRNNPSWEIHQTQFRGNVKDAHNVISIMVDGAGYLHMAWDHHGGPLNYTRSIDPEEVEFSDPLKMTGDLEDKGVTYPEFYKLPGGDLLFAYRYGASGAGNLVLNRYSTETREWERVHDNLIDGEGERNGYWQMCVDKAGSIHLSWVWRETWDVFTNHDLCYARSDDGGKTWHTSTEQQLKVPITLENAEYALKIPQGSSLINQTSITTDGKGNPYIASYWTARGDTIPQFYVVYLDEAGWNVSQASNRTMAFSLKGGGSRRIPVSRPQVVFSDRTGVLSVIFRDREKENKICVCSAKLSGELNWQVHTIDNIEVGQWEPSYDTELWRQQEKLHLFVQKVGQGEGNENPEDMEPQMVKILEFDELFF